jgi:polar amino acid transport system substrate-binding protein
VPTALLILCLTETLTWGGDLQGGEPYVYRDPSDPSRLIGFEAELADAIGAELREDTRFVQSDWAMLLSGLDRGTFDVAMNGIEATQERKKRYPLTRSYYRFELVRSVAKGSEGRNDNVGTLDGSFAASWLRAHDVQPKLYQGVLEPYLDLESGRIDAVLMDSVIAQIYGNRQTLTVQDAHVASGDYVIACAREARCKAVDAALSRVMASGQWRRILEKWHLWNHEEEALLDAQGAETFALPERRFTVGHLMLFVRGAGITLLVSIAAMALAAFWGLFLSSVRVFGSRPLSFIASAVVETFRGTPVLLQLYLVYFGLAPYLALSPLAAAVVTLGLNYGAYEAEVYRGGLSAVPLKQWDAGLALGLSRGQTFLYVVLPQALRVALPAMANDFVALLKDSALVSVITVVELTKQMQITAVDVGSWWVPGLVCAGLYLAMSLPAAHVGRCLERRLAT